jgi:copper(I)-binding protein
MAFAALATAQTPPLIVQDAWARATTPGADIAAVYLTLRNVSKGPVTVTGVRSSVAQGAMIHETTVQGGQSRMRPHEQLLIAAGETLRLLPGGLHVMLHGLTHPLVAGQSVPVDLIVAGAATVHVVATVRPLSAE